jgi:hypothetical protein
MKTTNRHRKDLAHHHPRVVKDWRGWLWECGCGGSGCLVPHPPTSWREATIEALRHSETIAP